MDSLLQLVRLFVGVGSRTPFGLGYYFLLSPSMQWICLLLVCLLNERENEKVKCEND